MSYDLRRTHCVACVSAILIVLPMPSPNVTVTTLYTNANAAKQMSPHNDSQNNEYDSRTLQ